MEIFRFVFSPIKSNTYVLADNSGQCAIIDCGCYNITEFTKLTDYIDNHGQKPVLLLNTHCHLDHVFGNRMFLAKYNLGTLCHPLEEVNRKNALQHAQFFGLVMEAPPEPAGSLSDGQIIQFGSVSLKALHVPGHTAGSLAFYCEEDKVIFTGDALFAGSIGRTDFPGGDHETLLQSIKDKLFTLPPATIVYPGHGESTTIEKEVMTNPFFN
jgi:hydroxyacylglutathione hydrolase